MNNGNDPLCLEYDGWNALSTSPERAKEFYVSVLSDDAQILLPGGMHLHGNNQILETMSGPPWDSFKISEEQLVDLSSSVKSVTYKVSAERAGSGEYHALICSTYAFRGGKWKLVIHQQTPA